MSDLVTTQIRALTAPGTSQPVRAPNGSHVLAATVTGSGAVAVALTWQGSNDLLGWVTLGTLSASGTGVASASTSTTMDYLYWQIRVDSLTGAQCGFSVVTAPAESGAENPSLVTVPVLSGVWCPIPRGFCAQMFVSGGINGGTYSFVMRRGTDDATLTTAETGSIAANTTKGVLVVADGVDQIKADFTGTATATF